MADNKCPVCSRVIKQERLSEWVNQWDEAQWKAPEFRAFIVEQLRDYEIEREKLEEIMPIYEKQEKYIQTLERQIELLQKTLDLAERFAPRPIIMGGTNNG